MDGGIIIRIHVINAPFEENILDGNIFGVKYRKMYICLQIAVEHAVLYSKCACISLMTMSHQVHAYMHVLLYVCLFACLCVCWRVHAHKPLATLMSLLP